ncbi:pectate lyase [Archangium minus]|uniref:Pectate lyase n=1 Tax=Archangium minus TaxID=83450 RepID=A0ABY9XAI2_9BACT|nr:pectate lyase [Archangium violaceum]WNG52408.1 pectate lyase [Archangium minus]
MTEIPAVDAASLGIDSDRSDAASASATTAVAAKTYYVSPTGKSTNTGASFNSAWDFKTALAAAVAGDTILLQGGTYSIPYTPGAKNTLAFTKSGQPGKPITVSSYNNARAVFDFSFPAQAWVQDSYGFYVTGSYWIFKGIDITRAGYQGAYVTGSYNTFENCRFYDNRNTGLEINKGGNHTTVLNCDAFRNYDPKKLGSMADGFGPKQTMGPGNVFIGCRAWENSDDGYDAFDSPEKVIFKDSWAFRNGVDVWGYGGFTGNGNGFKIGGNAKQANHQLTNCVAFGQPKKGFDQNNNSGGVTIYNSIAYKNGTNFGLGNPLNAGQKHILKNNISLGASNSIANSTEQKNSWNTGFSVSSADFQSLDTSLATVARNPDGSLPATTLFRLKSTSALVNAGVDVGLPYNGSAPDLGAFETP